jgi:hypothetical protein
VLVRELREGEGVFVSPLLLDDLFLKQKGSVIYTEDRKEFRSGALEREFVE